MFKSAVDKLFFLFRKRVPLWNEKWIHRKDWKVWTGTRICEYPNTSYTEIVVHLCKSHFSFVDHVTHICDQSASNLSPHIRMPLVAVAMKSTLSFTDNWMCFRNKIASPCEVSTWLNQNESCIKIFVLMLEYALISFQSFSSTSDSHSRSTVSLRPDLWLLEIDQSGLTYPCSIWHGDQKDAGSISQSILWIYSLDNWPTNNSVPVQASWHAGWVDSNSFHDCLLLPEKSTPPMMFSFSSCAFDCFTLDLEWWMNNFILIGKPDEKDLLKHFG